MNQRSIFDQFIADSLDLEVDKLLQVLYFFKTELVVLLALCMMLEDGVLSEYVTVGTKMTSIVALVKLLLDVKRFLGFVTHQVVF